MVTFISASTAPSRVTNYINSLCTVYYLYITRDLLKLDLLNQNRLDNFLHKDGTVNYYHVIAKKCMEK
jgi:hypothetical protein